MVSLVLIPGAVGVAATTLQAAIVADTALTVGTGGLGAAVALGGTTAVSAGAATATVGASTATAVAGGGAAFASSGLTAAALAIGPLGLALLGTSINQNKINFDCWKEILHENSKDTNGRLLKEIVKDDRVKIVKYNHDMKNLIIRNKWDEDFEIEFFRSPSNSIILAHATKIS